MSMMIDFSKATTLEPVEGGTYEAQLSQFKFVPKTKSSGNPGLRFDFILTDPEVEGKKAFITKSLMPEGLWSTKEWLIKIGVDADTLNQPMTLAQFQAMLEQWNHQFAGTSVRLVLSVDEVDGRRVQRIDQVLSMYDL